jgi:hypothetical protein
MFLFITATLMFASLFVIVLPGAVLVAALLVHLRRSPKPEVRRCSAADMTDPGSEPCSAVEGAGHGETHRPLERAS